MKRTELEERLMEAQVAIGVLWSTLEAVHDAMGKPGSNSEIYKEAIFGAANAAYDLKVKLEQVIYVLMRKDDEG